MMKNEKNACTKYFFFILYIFCSFYLGAHNFRSEKVDYSMQWFHWNARIGAKMRLISLHILWIWILQLVHHEFLGSEKFLGTHLDALNPFTSKLMILIPSGGLWTFSVNLALCASRVTCTASCRIKNWQFVFCGQIYLYLVFF